MIISRTPFRISFFGGGTDFPEYFNEHGGATLLTAIDKFSYISIHRLSAFFKHSYIAHYSKTERVLLPSEFEHPLIRESMGLLDFNEPIEISHVSDLPGRTGLGTSSSFTVGLLHTLHTFREEKTNAAELATEAIAVERERVGDPGGHQDQYAAAYGGFRRFDFSGDHDVRVTDVTVTADRLEELGDRLMLFYTGIEKSASNILNEQRSKTKTNIDALKTMKGMVDEGEKILTDEGNLDAFGDLLHNAWEYKKSLSSGISNPQVNEAYEAARGAGARGGKLLGAGGRGFLLLYATPETQDAIRKKLLHAYQEVDFSFCPEGSRIIFQTDE